MSHLDKNLPLASMYNRAKFHPVTPNITALVRAQTDKQTDKQTNKVLYSIDISNCAEILNIMVPNN